MFFPVVPCPAQISVRVTWMWGASRLFAVQISRVQNFDVMPRRAFAGFTGLLASCDVFKFPLPFDEFPKCLHQCVVRRVESENYRLREAVFRFDLVRWKKTCGV